MDQQAYLHKRQERQLPRLKIFMDVVYAIMFWRIFMHLPRLNNFPNADNIWDLLTADPDSLVMVVIGVFFIVTYWVQNNRLFSHIVRTDGKHTTISIVQVFFLFLYLYSVSLGIRFEDDTIVMLLQSGTLALAGFMSMWGWKYAVTQRTLIDPDMPDDNIPYMHITILPEPITACFTMPFALVGQLAWDLSWLAYPVMTTLVRMYVKAHTPPDK